MQTTPIGHAIKRAAPPVRAAVRTGGAMVTSLATANLTAMQAHHDWMARKNADQIAATKAMRNQRNPISAVAHGQSAGHARHATRKVTPPAH